MLKVFEAVAPFGDIKHSRLQYNECSVDPCDDLLLLKMFLDVWGG